MNNKYWVSFESINNNQAIGKTEKKQELTIYNFVIHGLWLAPHQQPHDA